MVTGRSRLPNAERPVTEAGHLHPLKSRPTVNVNKGLISIITLVSRPAGLAYENTATMNDDNLIGQVYHKIEREKALINAANAMRQSSNPQVQSSLDAQIREGRKNIEYLEGRLRELKMRRVGQSMEGMSLGPNSGGPPPPSHGGYPPQQDPRNHPYGASGGSRQQGRGGYGGDQGGYGDPPDGGYMEQLGAGQGMMPPRPPYGPTAPGLAVPKARPNYSKLGRRISRRTTE